MFSACLAVCVALSAPSMPPGRVLFVGNSLTYVNDLPGMVRALVDSSGAGHIEIHSVTAANFSVGDHWDEGTAVAQIRKHRPDIVVFQQGPSGLDASRADLIAAAARFDVVVREVGGRTALYGVWPERARSRAFEQVGESYRLAAERVHGLFLPAGEGWRAAWRRDSSLALYGPDAFHPSILGTYVAALVIYGGLTGRSPLGLPARLQTLSGVLVDVPPGVARLLQEAAAEALARFPS